MSLLTTMKPWELRASWAVWDDVESKHGGIPFTSSSNLRLPVAELHADDSVLRSDFILLGYNPGTSRAHVQALPVPWENFHAGSRHNDHLLAQAFTDSPAWGAYMVDLSSQITSKIHEVDMSDPDAAISLLAEQICALHRDRPVDRLTVVVFGKKGHAVVETRREDLAKRVGMAGSAVQIHCVPHWSGSNAGQHKNSPDLYRKQVHSAMGW